MNYKVGDVVIITAPHGEYNASTGLSHVEDMNKYTGEVAIISYIDDWDDTFLLEVAGEDTSYYWVQEWVEPYASCEEDPDFDVDMTSLL